MTPLPSGRRAALLALGALGLACAERAPGRPAPLAPTPRAGARARPAPAPPARMPPPPPPTPDAPPIVPPERSFRLPLVDPDQTRAVLLLYHAFGVGRERLSVSTRDFAAHLGVLTEGNAELVTTTELVEFLEGRRRLPARVVVLTIDDGMSSVYTRAWPLLRDRGARFTLGVPTGLVGLRSRAGSNMSWEQLRELVDTGLCEIASHGHLHRRLPSLNASRRAEELELSRQLIARELGRAPVAYFYPLGAHDTRTEPYVRAAGYRGAFVASGAPVALGSSSLLAVPRTSVFYGDSASLVAHYASDGFLGRVRARPERLAFTAGSAAR
ncbi:MAG: polysaccharide deacetylase family protein [Polyangiaceae bacterium]|nr:polysaccharide deacetylase family protein [Polyangiaceae bacterium]